MKAVKVTIARRDIYLVYNGLAMFNLEEKFGSSKGVIEAIEPRSKDSLKNISEVVAILAEQGELARRYWGYEAEPILKAENYQVLIMPSDMWQVVSAIANAISLGYGREIEPENNEVDLGLIELNEKKTV